MTQMDLRNKVIVITGGSSGIGEELVKQASGAGAQVYFTYMNGFERAQNIGRATRAGYKTFLLGDRDQTSSLLDAHMVNSIDYFIANAGIEFSGGLEEHTWNKIDRVLTTNLNGNLYLLQGFILLKKMIKGGQISVIGSIAADGNHDQLAYSASKAGLRGAVESLSRYDKDVKSQELGVKLLEPAFVRTPMTERLLNILERRMSRKSPDLLARFKQNNFVMDPSYAAEQILTLTVDPKVTGVRAIPASAKLHDIRNEYIG